MLSQLVLNGVIAGSIYALVALGFVLIYSTTRFFHFAHGIVFTAGAYCCFFLCTSLQAPLFLAVLISLAASALLGGLLDVFIYRPLRKRNASSLVLLLVSLGVYIVLQNTISMTFGDDAKRITAGQVQEGIALFGGRITKVQMLTAGVGIVLVGVVSVVLRSTRLGVVIRAVADDRDLALLRGINNDSVIFGVFAGGSLLAGCAGILSAFDVGMTPIMGMRVLMMGIVAVVIGGLNNPLGAAFGALLLGLAQQLGVWKLGSEWQDAIAFVILTGFLILRPEGLWGKRVRSAGV